MELNRRDFLKVSATGVGGLILVGGTSSSAKRGLSPAPSASGNGKAMLYDASKCVGCRACQTACKRWNKMPPESSGYGDIYDNPPDLSAKTWTLIKAREFGANGSRDLLLAKYQCVHCTDAACVKVCPTGAVFHHNLGFVGYDKDKCSGCGYCAEFCPFQVPRLSGSRLTGMQKMAKCTFCQDRVSNGQQTACAEACPAGAITYGNRDRLVAEGKKRADELRQTYPNAVLYGEKELSGLQVMYVLKQPPGVYQLPRDPQVPAAATAWQDVLKPVGMVAGGAMVLGLLLNYFVARTLITKEKQKRG